MHPRQILRFAQNDRVCKVGSSHLLKLQYWRSQLMNAHHESYGYAPWLWLLLGLFCVRVLGQMLVAFLHVSFLPPMEEWYSGLIPYQWLLPSQFLIILLYGKVCLDFTRGQGFFVVPRRTLGLCLLSFGSVYFGAMVVRYVIRMSLYPQERWLGGSIPIFFHWVLAGFILLVGRYHVRKVTLNVQPLTPTAQLP